MTGEHSQQGFTLLELLIGLTLLGFMLALLFGGFHLASTAWDTVGTHVNRTTDEQLAREFLRRLIMQMQPIRWKGAPNQPIAFTGDVQSLRAIAPISSQAGAGGLQVVEILAEPSADGNRLTFRHAPLHYGAEQFTDGLGEGEGHLLLDAITGVEFAYFGPPKKGEPSAWQDAWENPEQLPALIRIRIASSSHEWPDLIVAQMVGSTGCSWDDLTQKCK